MRTEKAELVKANPAKAQMPRAKAQMPSSAHLPQGRMQLTTLKRLPKS